MSLCKLPSGRWRAQVPEPATGRNVSVSRILGGPGTFSTKREAKAARAALGRRRPGDTTVGEFWDRWTTDPLFARPKTSTNIHNRERTAACVERHRALPLRLIDEDTVAAWLAGGKRNGTIPALRLMLTTP